MWRVLVILGLLVSTAASVEARGLRITLRPRLFSLSRPIVRPVDRKPSESNFFLRQERSTALPAASILDAPHEAVEADASRAPLAKTIDPSAHWCDNGQVFGSGTGFCVLNVSAGAPS